MSDARVLVLNKAWMPVAVCDFRRAFGLLATGAAKALDEQYQAYDFESWQDLAIRCQDDSIGTVSAAVRIPRILLLQAYEKVPRTKVRFSRQNVYRRDKLTCQYCGKKFPRQDLNLDHVIPRCQGGITSWENIVCSCVKCNLVKGGRTPKQAGMTLRSTPRRPKWSERFSIGSSFYSEWLPFVSLEDAAYWNVEIGD